MGQVWRARHATLDGLYAVKLVDVRTVPDAAGRFQMEAHIAAKLSKKTRHIVSVTDHGEHDHHAYLVMQLLEGESLEQRIAAAAPLGLGEVSVIVAQVARALTHAHADGFIHRDLKPGNVFLTKDEDGRVVVKLLDFGIARSMTPIRTRSPFATGKDMLVGTPSYMSPEQTLGLSDIDHRCDLWALSVVAYEALTRELPFEGESIQDVLIAIGIGRQVPIRHRRPELPEEIDAFYGRAFADALDDRFSSAEELAAAFASVAGVAGVGPSVRPSMPALTAPKTPPASRDPADDIVVPMQRGVRREVWIGVGVVALLAIGAVTMRALRAPPATDSVTLPPSSSSPSSSPSSSSSPPTPSSSSSVVAPPLPSVSPSSPPRVPSSIASAPPPGAPPRAPATDVVAPSAADASPVAVPIAPPETTAPTSAAPPSAPPITPAPARSIDRGEVF